MVQSLSDEIGEITEPYPCKISLIRCLIKSYDTCIGMAQLNRGGKYFHQILAIVSVKINAKVANSFAKLSLKVNNIIRRLSLV